MVLLYNDVSITILGAYMMEDMEIYLKPTYIIDSDSPEIREYASMLTQGLKGTKIEMAKRIYYAVRDGIWYDPYTPFYLPEHYKASVVLRRGRGFCVSKASVLCALGRACNIPTRVGFADVKNHLVTKELLNFLGTDLFVYHGFVEFHLNGRWIKATPAFNRELCERHKVPPLEFNGYEDSLFQPYNLEKKRFMEYVKYHGTFHDIPVDKIVSAWKEAYGKERVEGWIRSFKSPI